MTDTLPPHYTIRAPTMEDAKAVQAVMIANDLAEIGRADAPIEVLLSDWQAHDFNLATDAWVILTPENRIVAYARLSNRRFERFIIDAYVHPDFYGQGLGRTLARLAEARSREQLVQAPPGKRVVLQNVASLSNKNAHQLFESEGYIIERHFWQMGITLDAPPPPPTWPPHITVRPFNPEEDTFAVYQVNQEAFADQWGYVPATFESWQHNKIQRSDYDPKLWFLAMDGTQIAGILLGYVTSEDGWIETVAVRPPWRRQGLALALLQHAFVAFQQQGTTPVGLSVDAQNPTGATKLYEKAGMHIVAQYTVYQKVLRPE